MILPPQTLAAGRIGSDQILSWFVMTVCCGWAAFLASRLAINLSIMLNIAPDGSTPVIAESDTVSAMLYLTGTAAMLAYGATAWLVHRRHWAALPVYLAAFVMGISVWIVASATIPGYDNTSIMHAPLTSWIANIVLLSVLTVLAYLVLSGELRKTRQI